MRDIGGELFCLLESRIQPFDHAIKGVDQPIQLVIRSAWRNLDA